VPLIQIKHKKNIKYQSAVFIIINLEMSNSNGWQRCHPAGHYEMFLVILNLAGSLIYQWGAFQENPSAYCNETAHPKKV